MVGVRGLEPPTSRSQSAHSSQLSYTPTYFYKCEICKYDGSIYNKSRFVKQFFMKRLFSSIIGSYVLVKGQSRPVHMVQNLIINPSNGVLMAIVVDNAKDLIVVVEDILFFGNFIQINDIDSIVEYGDIIRIAKIIDKGVWFIDSRVETASGEFLGVVYDLEINTFLVVNTLHISKKVFGFFKTDKRIISTQDILRVRKGVVVVKDSVSSIRGEENTIETLDVKEVL